MSKQEMAGQKELARHYPNRRIRNGQINCICGWKTETTGQAKQQKSFRRHQTRRVLVAANAAEGPQTGKLFDLSVTLKGTKGEETVSIAVAGTESVAIACMALHQVGKPEYISAIMNGIADPEGWEDEDAS